MSTPRHAVGLGLFLAITSLAVCLVQAQQSTQSRPLTEANVVRMVELKIKGEIIASLVKKQGLDFTADDAAIERLKKAGAADVVLDAVRQAGAIKPAPTTDKLVTYQDVLELLNLGVPEPEIVARVRRSPTTFILDEKQVDELKRAGATDKLLEAMRAVKPDVGPAGEIGNLAIVLDCSGSMGERTAEGRTKMQAAREAAVKLVQEVPKGIRLSFIIYGHDRAQECNAVRVVRRLGPLDARGRATLIRLIGQLQPVGSTPIALALRAAGQELARAKAPSGLVLISDGKETCGGNPTSEAVALTGSLRLDYGVHVVGFGVKADERQALEEIVQAVKVRYKSQYYDAPTPAALRDVVQSLDKIILPSQPGFRSLFNGRDLAGWEGLGSYWQVRNSSIVGSLPRQDIGFNTFLCTTRTYRDFELTFKVKLGRGGNSGLQIRSWLSDRGKYIVEGPQCEIGNARKYLWGSLVTEPAGQPHILAPEDVVAHAVKEDDFNNYHIRCVGKHVTIRVNGETTVDDEFPSMPDEGIIALQLHHYHPMMEVMFKGIELKDLSQPEPTDGFRPLFNGQDLSGWVVDTGDPRAWRVDRARGELVSEANPASQGWLLSDREYADYILKLEFAPVTESANSGVAMRAVHGENFTPGGRLGPLQVQLLDDTHPGIDIPADQKCGALLRLAIDRPAALSPLGSWNTMEVEARGQTLRVSVNGREVFRRDLELLAPRAGDYPGLSRRSGRIGFESWRGTVRFRNIRLRVLEAAPAPSPAPVDVNPVVKVLIEQLSDQEVFTRAEAARSLAKLQDKAAVPALVKRVGDNLGVFGFSDDKDAALEALKLLAPDRVQEALMAAARSNNADVKKWAMRRLTDATGK